MMTGAVMADATIAETIAIAGEFKATLAFTMASFVELKQQGKAMPW
jgi:hypothetical protein